MSWWKWSLAGVAGLRAFGPTVTPNFSPGQVHPWRVPGRTVFVGDREFMVRETGPIDGSPVVLIHGLAGSSLAEWYRVGPILATSNRVVMVDHRSHGLSPQSRARFDIDEDADEVAGVLAQLDLGPVPVVGYSLGGTIAQALANRHPAQVSRLVLLATFSSHPPLQRALRTAGLLVARGWERLTGAGTPEVRSGYLLFTQAVDPTHARWLWEESHRRDPDAGAQASFAMLRFDSREWIGRLSQPLTIVIPTADQLIPAAWQYQLAALAKDPVVVEVAGGQHELPWTHPELVARVISEAIGT